jgi:hypothetical protein
VALTPQVSVDLGQPAGTGSTLIGPTGTAPELEVLTPPDRPLDDSSPGRTHVLPLFVAGLLLVVVLTVVLVRAQRARRTGGGSPGRGRQLPDGSSG